MRDEVVLRTVATLLVPFVLLFGLYVTFHGETGPGGGFQGGVIMAAGLVLVVLAHGMSVLRRLLTHRTVLALAAAGVAFYAGVGVASLLAGGEFLDYGALRPANPVSGEMLGITLVELGVALAVAGTMLVIFAELSGEGEGA